MQNRQNKTSIQYSTDPVGYMKEYLRNYQQEIRLKVIDHYGGACECCGETNPSFLCLDHLGERGVGNRHREKVGKGISMYRWIVKNNFPVGIFQVLCHNCNMAKGLYGVCPHQAQD